MAIIPIYLSCGGNLQFYRHITGQQPEPSCTMLWVLFWLTVCSGKK